MPPLIVPDRLRLPSRFDAARLQEDLARMPPAAWVPHFNTRYYEGEWSGVPLRSVGGAEGRLYPDPTARESYADTPVLERYPAFRQVLSTFRCPIGSARLLKLAAGARIREHTDYNLGFDDGEVRLHIPIVTHPDVAFFLTGTRVVLQPGECWYLDFNLPHRVENPSDTDRVHLVLDCQVDDWLRAVFAEAVARQPDFERFRRLVLEDAALQEALRDTPDVPTFIALARRLGAGRGCDFTAEDVQEAMRAARRAWLERWI